jgi:hypothetical protein
MCKCAENSLAGYRELFTTALDNDSRNDVLEELKDVTNFFKNKLAPQLRYIEGASAERTPWSMVQPLEKLIRPFLTDTQLIFRPQWHYDYGRVEILDDYHNTATILFSIEDQERIFNKLPRYINVLSFPGIEKMNVLLHVNIGHEIGHLLQKDFFNGSTNSAFLSKIKDKVNTIIPETIDYSSKTEKLTQYTEKVFAIFKKGLEEIMADLCCAKLFGFAAIFAFYEIAVFSTDLDRFELAKIDLHCTNLEQINEGLFYPPWRTRLREVLNNINWAGYEEIIDKIGVNYRGAPKVIDALHKNMQFLFEIIKDKTDQENICNNDFTRIAYETIYEALPEGDKFLNDKLKPFLFSLDQNSCCDIFCLIERLFRYLPPNEILVGDESRIKIADIKHIFNAGWLYRVAYFSSIFDFEDLEHYFHKIDILNRLVLKGIELSDLQKDYMDFKEMGKA